MAWDTAFLNQSNSPDAVAQLAAVYNKMKALSLGFDATRLQTHINAS